MYISVTNTSISGGSMQTAKENVYNAITPYNPDLLILALGVNDYQFQYSAGKVLGGLFKVLGFLLKLAFYPLIFLWNVIIMIVSFWFAPAQVLKIPMKLNIGGDSSDARYYYEDRKYKQSEERRKQEKHEKEMGRLKPDNPDAELIKLVKDLNKADEAAKEKRREDREKSNE